jgi:hypothetical protein
MKNSSCECGVELDNSSKPHHTTVERTCNASNAILSYNTNDSRGGIVMPVLEKIIAEVRALQPAEQQRLREILEAKSNHFDPVNRINQLALEQGTKPLSFDEMLGDFWPEDEGTDDFLNTFRKWRNESGHLRNLIPIS